MKKIFIFITIFIALLSVGCTPESNGDGIIYEENAGHCEFVIVEKDSFYYPTISGYVALKVVPDKVCAVCASNEFELNILSVNYSNDCYILNFRQTQIFRALGKTTYDVDLKVYYNDDVAIIEGFGELVSDDIYTALNGYDVSAGEYIYAMDKESNWVGPI